MLASPLLRQAPASCALQAVATQPPCTASAIIARSTRRGCAPVCASARSAAPVVLSAAAPPQLPYRVGHGFDLHRLAPGLRLVLGGVDVPSEKGCEAHSDGDVLIHTVVDAVLGALGLPDIGQLFPDTDPQWKGASSDRFLLEAMRRCREAGYEVGNLDATLITQKPKLSPHKVAIKTSLCKLMDVHESCVNIKAKTHEKVDAIGEERAIGCHAVVMLYKK